MNWHKTAVGTCVNMTENYFIMSFSTFAQLFCDIIGPTAMKDFALVSVPVLKYVEKLPGFHVAFAITLF